MRHEAWGIVKSHWLRRSLIVKGSQANRLVERHGDKERRPIRSEWTNSLNVTTDGKLNCTPLQFKTRLPFIPFYMEMFNESAHWAYSVSKSRCPSVCLCVPSHEIITDSALWAHCYYPHTSRESVFSVYGICFEGLLLSASLCGNVGFVPSPPLARILPSVGKISATQQARVYQ